MKKYRLRKLLIKPTFAYNASYKNCIYRPKLYNKLKKEDILTFDDWKGIPYVLTSQRDCVVFMRRK